jgi:hypothetical protein
MCGTQQRVAGASTKREPERNGIGNVETIITGHRPMMYAELK